MAMFNYESEALYQQVRGETPPSTPVYVAECKKEMIDEVSPNYPQLVEYEKEWINFAQHVYHDGTPVPLEYQEVDTYDDAIVETAIPFYYKGASLKGQTLINHMPKFEKIIPIGTGVYRGIYTQTLSKPLKPNTSYLFINHSNVGYALNVSIKGETTDEKVVISKLITSVCKFTTPNNTEDFNKVMVYLMTNNEIELTYNTFMIIEYQDGMENWDIPYFEGMQSVEMPVLRTTGKNLFNNNIFKNESDEFEFPYEKWKMQLKPNTTYIANSSFTRPNNDKTNYDSYGAILNGSKQIEQLYLYHWNLNLSFVNKIFTTDDTGVIYLGWYKGDCPYHVRDMIEMQIEEGSTATSYEPHKSNILTVNEDITLRSNGDVYDELNLLTGRLTQRIDENNEVLAQEVVKTVALNQTIKPYEGTNHYQVSSDTIPPQLLLSVPVVSTGNQTLNDILMEE